MQTNRSTPQERGMSVCKAITSLLVAGGIAGSIYAIVDAVKSKAHNKRIRAMIDPTGEALIDLANAAWATECQDNTPKFKAFVEQMHTAECETAFEQFAQEQTNCTTPEATQTLQARTEAFQSQRPPRAKAHEDFLRVTCDHTDRVLGSGEKYRKANLIQETGKAYAQLKNAAYESECEGAEKELTLLDAANNEQCTDVFDDILQDWNDCESSISPNTTLGDAGSLFKDKTGAFGRDNESFLQVTCDEPFAVTTQAKAAHKEICFEQGFMLETELSKLLSNAQTGSSPEAQTGPKAANGTCQNLTKVVTDFLDMKANYCTTPALALDQLAACSNTTLIPALKAYTNSNRTDDCYTQACASAAEIQDVAQVKDLNSNRPYHGFGMFYLLGYGAGGRNIGGSTPISITSRSGQSTRATRGTGRSTISSGRAAGVAVRGAGGRSISVGG